MAALEFALCLLTNQDEATPDGLRYRFKTERVPAPKTADFETLCKLDGHLLQHARQNVASARRELFSGQRYLLPEEDEWLYEYLQLAE